METSCIKEERRCSRHGKDGGEGPRGATSGDARWRPRKTTPRVVLRKINMHPLFTGVESRGSTLFSFGFLAMHPDRSTTTVILKITVNL